ncbi:hypothetical protein ACH5RR_034839 [Cinchona calisaya]|uniref:Rapid ALkalinization Factor n=1 Tax=Cinchona calisaya TaxID=153742 RepID=A0ABD2YD97_9GENT
MGVSSKGISQELCSISISISISWQLLLLLIFIFLLNLQSANCVSSIENIPSGYEVGWGNNWTTVATSNEAEYVTDSDEELFLMESHHQHEYYKNILDSQTDTINARNALSLKPICHEPRYQYCVDTNPGGGRNPCGFKKRRCRPGSS